MQRPLLRRFFALAVFCSALSPTFVAGQSSSSATAAHESSSGPTTNPYDLELRSLQQQMSSATPAARAVLLRRGYELRDYINNREALTKWLEAISSDSQQNPLVRDEAQRWLYLIDLHQGRLKCAEARYDALGFVRAWSIVGPFLAAGLDSAAGPEGGYDPKASYLDSSSQERHWRQVSNLGPNTWLDLADFYSRSRSSIAFAAASLYSNQQRVVALRFSSDSAFVLWVNGHVVFSRRETSNVAFDQHAVAVGLYAGWNTVLVKFYRGPDEAWRFGLRVTEMHGGGVPLRASASQPWKQTPGSVPFPASAPDDLVDLARRSAEANPSASAWETLARIEQQHARGTPLESIQHALTLGGSPEQWLALATMTTQESERFRALDQALRRDPNFVPARVALADYYSRRRQREKARELLRRALTASPADFLIRKRLADFDAAAGLKSRAATVYCELEQQFPQPLWLKRELAERWEEFGLLDRAGELVRRALRDNFDGTEERLLLESIAQRRHDATTLHASYEELLRLKPSDTSAMAKLAALQAGSRDFAAATSTMRAALAVDPENDDLHRRLGEILAQSGQAAESRQELERALALNPQAEDLHRRLQPNLEDPDGPYLVNAAELARAMRAKDARTAGDTFMLANIRIQRVQQNGLDSVRVQQVTYITTEDGARKHSVANVQYAPGTEQLRVLHARVYKPDGRVIEGESGGDSAVSDASVAMYYHVGSRAVRFRQLEKGDIIELDYRLSPLLAINPYGNYFGELVTFGSELEQRLQRYVLIVPAARKLYIREERMAAPASVTTSRNERVYQWEAHDLPALTNELRGPALTEIAPYVHVSTFGSWQELGQWYAQLIQPQFQLDAALRDALAHILEHQRTAEDRIRAIHGFVLRNTHYVALEFGIYSYKPYPVSEVYARRFGDCKDKASLMIALLRAAGIEADIALVRTRRLGAIGENPASISIFNHAIAYVPRYNLWLDGTAEYAGPRELPLDDQGAMALTVAIDGHSELRQIPVSSASENVTRRTVYAKLESNGAIRFSGGTSVRGEDAPGLRRDFETTERQRDSIRQRLAEVFPSVRLDAVTVDGAHDLDRDVTMEFRGTLDTFTGHKIIPLAASWMPRRYGEDLAPLATRSQDLLLSAPWTTEEELRFALPPGAILPPLPTDSRIESAFGVAALHYRQQQRELIVRSQVQFRMARIHPQEYPAFRAFCSELERTFRRELKVVLP